MGGRLQICAKPALGRLLCRFDFWVRGYWADLLGLRLHQPAGVANVDAKANEDARSNQYTGSLADAQANQDAKAAYRYKHTGTGPDQYVCSATDSD